MSILKNARRKINPTLKRMVQEGASEEELQAYEKELDEKLASIPDDFGPDWIDSLDTIRKHNEEQGFRKSGKTLNEYVESKD